MISNLQQGPAGIVSPVDVILVRGMCCPYCDQTFVAGEEYTLVPRLPKDPEACVALQRAFEAGHEVKIGSDPAHWSCLLNQYLFMAVWRPGYRLGRLERCRGVGVA